MMRVLVVEDDYDMQDAISESLENEGHEATCVSNGREALDYLRSGNPVCVILLDLMMPVMNGWEFRQRQLQSADLASIPVVVVTADGHAAEKAQELSADGFLRKPLIATDLLSTVEKFCPKQS
jgi:two-component system response regulator MprA